MTVQEQETPREKTKPPKRTAGNILTRIKLAILERTRPYRRIHYWTKKAFDELLAIRITRFFVQLIMFLLLNWVAITWVLGYDPLFSSPLLLGVGWLVPTFGYIPLPYVMPHGNPAGTGVGFLDGIMLIGSSGVFPYLALGIALLVPALLGRSFCGWICPFGFVQDMCALTPIRTRAPSRQTNDNLSSIKYVVLGITLLFTTWLGMWTFLGIDEAFRTTLGPFATAFWSVLSPEATFFVLIPLLAIQGHISPYVAYWGQMLSWGPLIWFRIIFLVIVLLLALFVRRPYCRWICPTGALMGLFSRFSLLGISRRPAECPGGSCESQRCQKECPMAVRVMEAPWGRLYSGDCIMCLDCRAKCPRNAIEVTFP